MGRKAATVPNGYFTVPQAVRITGVSGRTLRSWIAGGVIQPARAEHTRGKSIWLTYRNLLEIKIVLRLREKAPLSRIKKALTKVIEMGYDSPDDVYFIDATSDDIEVYLDEATVMSAVRSAGQLLLVDLMDVKEQLKQEVRQLRAA